MNKGGTLPPPFSQVDPTKNPMQCPQKFFSPADNTPLISFPERNGTDKVFGFNFQLNLSTPRTVPNFASFTDTYHE